MFGPGVSTRPRTMAAKVSKLARCMAETLLLAVRLIAGAAVTAFRSVLSRNGDSADRPRSKDVNRKDARWPGSSNARLTGRQRGRVSPRFCRAARNDLLVGRFGKTVARL